MARDIGTINDYANDPNAQTAVRHIQGALAHELTVIKTGPERDWMIKLIIRIGGFLEQQYQGHGFIAGAFVTGVGVTQDEIAKATRGGPYLELTLDEITERRKTGLAYPYLTPAELENSRKAGFVYPKLTQAEIDKRQSSGLVYPYLTEEEVTSNQKAQDAKDASTQKAQDAQDVATQKTQDAQNARDVVAVRK